MAGVRRRPRRPDRTPSDARARHRKTGDDMTKTREDPGRRPAYRRVGKPVRAAEAPAPAADAAEGESKAKAGARKLKRKDYERELAKLHVELVKLQQWVVHKGLKVVHRLRGARRGRQGRHDQGADRAREPARVPRGRAARADRAREDADVRAALHPALPGGGRGRDLRPQLVQPRRGRARDGLLHRGAGARFLADVPLFEQADGRDRASSCSSTGWKSAPRSRPGGSRSASTTGARRGSSRRWTSSPTAAGTTTRARATRCSPPPTRDSAPWFVARSDDKKRLRLTSSAIC